MKKIILLISCFYLTTIVHGMMPQKGGKFDESGVLINGTIQVEKNFSIGISDRTVNELNSSAWQVTFEKNARVAFVSLPGIYVESVLLYWQENKGLPPFPVVLPVKLFEGKNENHSLVFKTRDNKCFLVLRYTNDGEQP